MNILHIIESLDPAAGGPPLIAASLAAAQAASGECSSLLYATDDATQDPLAWIRKQVPQFEAVGIEKVAPAGFVQQLVSETGRLDASIEAADVIHLHSVWEPLLIEAGRACRRLGKPYLILLNGMLDPWSLSQSRWKKWVSLQLFHRRHLNGAASLHAGNPDEEKLIRPLMLRASVDIIPNGIFLQSVNRPGPPDSFASRTQGLEEGEDYILFLSRLHYKKGLDLLAEAFERFASSNKLVKLVVAGPDGGAEADFRARIAAAGLEARVILTGPLQGDEKHLAFRDAACFCLPSRQEGFSMACIEALAYGKAAVITEGCHFPAVAEVGAGRVVAVASEAIAEALLEVMADPALRERMGHAGVRHVEQNLTWERVGNTTRGVYERLLTRG